MSIRNRLISTVIFLGLGACVSAGTPSPQLVKARQAYAVAAASTAPVNARQELANARSALNDAELAYREGDDRREEALAFVATRRAQIATARAGAAAAAQLAARRAAADRANAAREAAAREAAAREAAQRPIHVEVIQPNDGLQAELAQKEAELAQKAEALEAERLAREKLEAERNRALDELKAFAMVVENERGTVITLGGSLLFLSNETTLLPTAREKLDEVATALQSIGGDRALVIEGHADSRGTDEFNRRLSSERANVVRAYLISRGVPPERLTSVGMGEANPVASNESAEGRANNRRVEIVISRAKSASIQ